MLHLWAGLGPAEQGGILLCRKSRVWALALAKMPHNPAFTSDTNRRDRTNLSALPSLYFDHKDNH